MSVQVGRAVRSDLGVYRVDPSLPTELLQMEDALDWYEAVLPVGLPEGVRPILCYVNIDHVMVPLSALASG